ncbi:PEP-CTERM sorting domain-containing protein [Pseudoduganella eburnea]|uniref:PEP-CTERM sorting domain-containing protein n=1 Tax=Massilia eburnea TaxID=1776165 RepID=A0A6L6QPU8_9BURK|nr:PEP-CTERM sorting domain-containing protein [Massilia eburnea]MTW14131.1 PEP-CTERM sorting domain-containing protein [Massilia eburnea]
MNKLLSAAVATALLSMASTSQAAPITLTGSIADGSWMGAGQHAGMFDGSSILPQHFKINSASFTFNFSDDQDLLSRGQAQTTGFSAGNYVLSNSYYDGWNYSYTYVRNKNYQQSVAQSGETEGASLSLAGIGAGSGATALTQSSAQNTTHDGMSWEGYSSQPGYYQYYSCGNRCSGSYWVSGSYSNYYGDQYTQTTTTTKDWNGSFSIAGEISNQDMLDQLLSSHKLDWNLLVNGDLNLSNARLQLDVEELAPPASVPEPSSMLLTGLGLLGLAGMKRRSRSRP